MYKLSEKVGAAACLEESEKVGVQVDFVDEVVVDDNVEEPIWGKLVEESRFRFLFAFARTFCT
jgi:hypothetical protein